MGSELTGGQFVTSRQGWVVGLRDILATADGGTTWSVQDRGRLNLTSVDFISSTHGWAVGENVLLRTTDGRSWTALPEPCPFLRAVHFVTPAIGFAIAGGSNLMDLGQSAPAESGKLMATDDGGTTWHPMAAPMNPQTVCFSTPSIGWLGADGRLYRSSDSGQSWRLVAAGARPFGLAYPATMYVQCAAGAVWAVDAGPGAMMSQEPHIGYHADATGAVPIFAEQYFPHPGVQVQVNSPGARRA
jgi:photosystem II stability/assembly factor-like uncharacterized protein